MTIDTWTIDKGLIPSSMPDLVFLSFVFRGFEYLSHHLFVSFQPQGLKLRLEKLETHTLRYFYLVPSAISFSFHDK
jgi:hypothetical protein